MTIRFSTSKLSLLSGFGPRSVQYISQESYLNLARAEDLCRLANNVGLVRLQYFLIHLK